MAKGLVKAERRRRLANTRTIMYDALNTILGIGIILCAFLLFVDQDKYEVLFPAVFVMAGAMDLVLGIKTIKRNEYVRGIALYVAAGLMLIMSLISSIALWF